MKRKWKYWQDDWPTARTFEEVILENKEESDKQWTAALLAKTHFVDLMAFGYCEVNGKKLTDDEIRQYAKKHFSVGQKLNISENGTFIYTGTLVNILEEQRGIVGKVIED